MTGDAGVRAVVLHGTGGVWHARTDDGEVVPVSLSGRVKNASTFKLAVGDNVAIQEDSRGGSWRIAEILPRRSQLTRREPGAGYGERVLAANVDQVVVVMAAIKPEPHLRMLDRFLAIAEANELLPRVVINKIDLVDEEDTFHRFADYRHAGYTVHLTSVKAGTGLTELRQAMDGFVSVYTGPSGVGKSSLLNTMYPGLNLRVGEISESVQKGRHTTVGGLLHPLPGRAGGYVVDTPGLREVGLWGLPPSELPACFPEFRAYLHECRFADCTHIAEPGCAVRVAVDSGTISRVRYDSYAKLRAELEEADDALASYTRRDGRRR
ncbi:ribosome small subunit-dependent GTPase A [soil metagenome]